MSNDKDNKRIDDLEGFLTDNDQQSKADAIADIRAHGIDTNAFFNRVHRAVQEGYSKQLRAIAASEQAASSPAQTFIDKVRAMSRDAMLAIFGRIQQGEFGTEYRDLAIARCRNKDASALSDEELRSWLEDAADILDEPDK
jgi:hypothetical protein